MAGGYFDKQPSSRILKNQVLNWTGAGTLFSTNFLNETWQIRVICQTAGYFSVVPSTGDATIPTTAATSGTFIPASTTGGEYFTVSPSLIFAYASTTTSTASPIVVVTEMA